MNENAENNQTPVEQDSAALLPEVENTIPEGESIASIADEIAAEAVAVEAPKQEAAPAKEPGWIRQRVDKAVAKAVAEAEARVAAQYENMLAPIRESMVEREAEDLVRSGEFKSIERAKEYVQLKKGQPVSVSAPQEQAPAANTDNPTDAVIKARSELLAAQATRIKNQRGVDVMSVFNSDPTAKAKVLSGEWDFYDIMDAVSAPKQTSNERMPSPVRSANGAHVDRTSISQMSDAQFKRLQQNLAAGRSYDLRK